MEDAFSRLLDDLPAPLAWLACAAVALLWLVPLYDNVARRRRLENAKLEREIWALELTNAEKSLELRRRFLGEAMPDELNIDGVVITQLLASGETYTIMGRKIREETESREDPRFWSAESRYSWPPLRFLDVATRLSFGVFLLALLLASVGAVAAALIGFEWPAQVNTAVEFTAGGLYVIAIGLFVVRGVAIVIHWISGENYGVELLGSTVEEE